MSRVYYPDAHVNLALVKRGDTRSDVITFSAVSPISARIVSNPVEKADTFEFDLEETYFPMDPRMVRTMSVGVHMGDSGSPDAELPPRSAENRMIWGFVDDIEKNYPNTDTDVVTFSGRDYSAPLLDKDWGDRKVELGRPLEAVVREILGTLPAVQQMQVVVEGFPGGTPVVGGGTPKENRFVASEGATLFEGLTEIARRAGAMVTVRFDEVVIRSPRTVQTSSSMPLFVSGRNLQDLTVRRQFGLQDLPNVLVQAVDPSSRQVIEGQFPRPFNQTVHVSRSGAGGVTNRSVDRQVRKFQIRLSSPSVAQLDAIAERIFRKYEQQQLEVEFQTRELETWETSAPSEQRQFGPADATFPVTQIRNGRSLRVVIDRESRNVLEKSVSQREKARQLRKEGYAWPVAEELARSWLQINQPLFVTKATHEISQGGSYSLDVTSKNAITVEA